jgi:hypothetical protein
MISGIKIKNTEDMKKAAKSIFSVSNIPCFITGGHFPKQMVNLLYEGNKFYSFKKEKIRKKVHGTGKSEKKFMEQDVFYPQAFWVTWLKETPWRKHVFWQPSSLTKQLRTRSKSVRDKGS